METKRLIERWRDQVQHRSVATSEVREIGNEMAELLDITETGYQQICLKNDALQALVGKMTDAMLASGKEQARLREALQRLLDWNEGIAAGRGNHYPREHADVARAALAPATN